MGVSGRGIIAGLAVGVWCAGLAAQPRLDEAAIGRIEGVSASPDGNWVACAVSTGKFDPQKLSEPQFDSCRLVLVDRHAGQMTIVCPPGSSGPVLNYGGSWSKDGSVFVFLNADNHGGKLSGFHAWTINPVNTRMNMIGGPGFGTDWNPRLAPDGATVLVRDSRGGDLVRVDMATGERTPMGLAGAAEPGRKTNPVENLAFDWSPDGSRVYFARRAGSAEALGVWVVGADGKDARRLGEAERPRRIAVSPSGAWMGMAVEAERAGGPVRGHRVLVASLPGWEVKEITDDGGLMFDWSRAGERLAFTRNGRLCVWDAGSRETAEIAPAGERVHGPSWMGATDDVACVRDLKTLWRVNVKTGESLRLVDGVEAAGD